MLLSKVSRSDVSLARAGGLLWRLLYGALLVMLVGLLAALSIAVVPRLFGYGILLVSGGSMGEAIPNGSLVIARWIAAEEVEPGDVILLRGERTEAQTHPKIHRVVSLEEKGGQILVRTKGDVNPTPDPDVYVLSDRVLSPALTLPYLGYLVGFLVTPLGWALLVMLPALALCTVTLWSIWAPEERPLTELGTSR